MRKLTAQKPHPRKNLLRLFGAAAVMGGVAWSCGDGGSSFDPTSPCATTYEGLCGGACIDDSECAAGLHCDAGACFAECVSGDTRCGDGVCNANGQCVSAQGGGGAGGSSGTFNPTSMGGNGAGGGGAEGGNCGSLTLELEPTIPTVVLLIDQSGSMNADFNGQGTRWGVVYDALMNGTDGVVKQLEGHVRFGLALYTWSTGTCPAIIGVNPPALNNHATIDGVYANETWDANTPTGDSITAITPDLVSFAEPGPKLIVLATDGDPDRCEDPDGHDAVSMLEATDAAALAYAQGVETVIIAVGNQVSDRHQQDMANAGSGRPVPSPFPCDPVADPVNCAPTYEPTSKQALVDTFTSVILGQRDCVFTLNGDVVPGKECDGTVKLNGVEMPCNDPDGWHLNGQNEIEFAGAACDLILTELNVDIEAEFPCDSILNPPE